VALHTMTDEGQLGWQCVLCSAQNTVHHSHQEVQWCHASGMPIEHATVRLPPCSGCESQTYLKVHFAEEELSAPNMWLAWTSERAQALVDAQAAYQAEPEGTVHKAALAYQIKALEAIRDVGGLHTESHAVALRHQELARQLKASGKVPAEQGEGQG
jgi:hypothetical protein